MSRTLLATLLLAAPLAHAASAEQTFIDSLARQTLLPRYSTLNQQSQALSQSLHQAMPGQQCGQPGQRTRAMAAKLPQLDGRRPAELGPNRRAAQPARHRLQAQPAPR